MLSESIFKGSELQQGGRREGDRQELSGLLWSKDLKMLTFRAEVRKTEQPIMVKIMKPVTRCSLIPKNFGCSPGAALSDSTFRLLT